MCFQVRKYIYSTNFGTFRTVLTPPSRSFLHKTLLRQIRCRHLSPDGRRVSMFRAAFHTGYVPSGVLRFTKQQLDGACADDRFHQVMTRESTEGEGEICAPPC